MPKMTIDNPKHCNIRMSAEMHAAIHDLARQNDRSFSSQLRVLLMAAIPAERERIAAEQKALKKALAG